MKKILLFLLILIIILSIYTTVVADQYEEELYNHSGKILENIGVLTGNKDKDLMLNSKLKRQDMVVLISRLRQEEDTAKNYAVKDAFSDIADSFYKPYISWSIDKKLIIGIEDKRFGYNDPVTVQQFQALLLRVLGYGDEIKDYKNVPEVAKGLGMMDSLSAKPEDSVSRGLMAAMSLNALRLNIRGSSLTLAKKLNLELPDKFIVSSSTKISRNNIRFEGTVKGTNKLKINLKSISKEINFEEKNIDVPLKEDGKFSLLIEKLPWGEYEYRFIGDELSTRPQSITLQEKNIKIKD